MSSVFECESLMNKNYLWVNIVGTIFLFVFVVFLSSYLFTSSSDFAHHYALIEHLSRYLHVDNAFGNLGEMAFYPNLGHWFAVVAGSLLGSSILGVTFVTYISLIVLWVVLFLLISELPRFVSYSVALIVVVFGIITSFYNAFFGFETVGNFFYAQMIAQSLALVAAYVYYALDQNRLKVYAIYVLFISPLLIAYAHVLPAMQLMVFAIIVVFLDFWLRKKVVVSYLILMLFSVVMFVLHPSLSAMKELSQNNGDLAFGFPSDVSFIASIAFLEIFISLVFVFWKKVFVGDSALKVIAIFALSSAILLLLQILAYQFGYGSHYAIKKHVFSVFTLLVIELSFAFSFVLSRFVKDGSKSVFFKYFYAAFFAILLIVIQVNRSIKNGDFISVSDLKYLESELTYLQKNVIPEKNKNNVVYVDKNNLISYLFSISILEHPRDVTGMNLLLKQDSPVQRNSLPSVVIVKSNYFDIDQNNKVIIKRDFILYQAEDFVEKKSIFDLNKYLNALDSNVIKNIYSQQGLKITKAAYILKEGWNSIENWGVWSSSRTALLELALERNDRNFTLLLNATSWLKSRDVTVSVNNKVCGRITVLPVDEVYAVNCLNVDIDDKTSVRFDITDYDESPKKLGISEDARTLGIGLKNIKILNLSLSNQSMIEK